MRAAPRLLPMIGLLLLAVTVARAFILPGQLLEELSKRKAGGKTELSPHKEDPEIAVCDKQLKRGNHCGKRPLCCQAATCQMFNTIYRTFVDCPHGAKNENCFCIEESLASRTDFSEYQ